MEICKEYNFKHQPERLKYIGKFKGWHQFERIGWKGVWCELLDSDLHMIEETKAQESSIKAPYKSNLIDTNRTVFGGRIRKSPFQADDDIFNT